MDDNTQAQAVKLDLTGLVKPLGWRLIDERTAHAKCRYVSDRYIIEHRLHGDHFDLWMGHNATTAARFDTLKAAKAAAQADYTARILAAIDTDAIAALVGAAKPCLDLLRGLVAESGRGVDWGEEDAFRMGEWFENHDIANIDALDVAIARLGGGE